MFKLSLCFITLALKLLTAMQSSITFTTTLGTGLILNTLSPL